MIFHALANFFPANFSPLFGDAAEVSAKPAGSPFAFVLMMFGVLVAMYLLFVLPRQSKEKQSQKMIDRLNKNDRVMTTSGLIGIVHSIDREAGEIVLKVDESNNTKLRFSLGAIYYLFDDTKENKEGKGTSG